MPNILKITAKCSDMFFARFGEKRYNGYVPDFMPGQHYGDYVQLDIDVNTGLIVNWKTPTEEQLKEVFKNND